MSAHEAAARTRKALALADELIGSFREHDTTPDAAVATVYEIKPEFWAQIAENAEVNPPSESTVAVVAEMVRHRLEQDADQDTDPFEGL